jgi:SAM-dependent methyltransferase
MPKQQIIRFLRSIRLLATAEKLRFLADITRNYQANRKFLEEHRSIALPPLWLAYDAYSSCNRDWYWTSGVNAADAILQYVPSVIQADSFALLEWGCGSGRILRQLRSRLSVDNVRLYGSDYNKRTIDWCRQTLDGIEFQENELSPPLGFDSEAFDLVYSVSVFTHLPEDLFRSWLDELFRVLKKGGLALITLNGERFKSHLSKKECESYERFGFASRGNVYSGSRLYNAYHRRDYVEKVCEKHGRIVLQDCNPSHFLSGGQDVYLIEKR